MMPVLSDDQSTVAAVLYDQLFVALRTVHTGKFNAHQMRIGRVHTALRPMRINWMHIECKSSQSTSWLDSMHIEPNSVGDTDSHE